MSNVFNRVREINEKKTEQQQIIYSVSVTRTKHNTCHSSSRRRRAAGGGCCCWLLIEFCVQLAMCVFA